MLTGQWKTATVASSGTLSDEVDLGQTFKAVQVIVPTIDNSTVAIESAPSSGGTYSINKTLGHETTGHISPATTTGVGGITVIFDSVYAQYIKILCGSAQTGGARSFSVRGLPK
jgi:hypothetical protein